MAETNYTNSPTQSVKRKVTQVGSKAGGALPTEADVSFRVSEANRTPEQLPPPGLSSEQIASIFAPLIAQAEQPDAALQRPVPSEITPMGTFLGALAGNLASTFAQNPMFAAQAQQALQENAERRAAIQDQNFAQELLAKKESRDRVFALRAQLLNTTIEEAIKAGDTARAEAAARNLQKLQADFRKEEQERQTAGQLAVTRQSGIEERRTLREKQKLEVLEEEKRAGKPLTSKEYQQGINDLLKNKELSGPGFLEQARRAFRGVPFVGGSEPSSREEALEQWHANAVLNAEPIVAKAAKANLKRLLLSRLGLLGQTPTPETKDRVRRELERYGLAPKDLQ